MKKLLSILAMLSLPLASRAQDPGDSAAQRERIAAGRSQAEAAFRAEEKACYARFAVNDCVSDARARRRAVLAELRREEIALNDADRKRQAAERLRELEERSSAEKQQQQAAQSAKSQADQREREALAAREAADRASRDAAAPAKAAARQEQVQRRQAEASAARSQQAQEAAQNVKKRQERLARAQERKAALEKRLSERKKQPAQPLPAPE